jgi:hypothetical protein
VNIFKLFFTALSRQIKKYEYDGDRKNEKVTENEQKNSDEYEFNKSTKISIGMAKKTVITKVLDVETSDAIIEFPQNRTLLAEQLTDEAPVKPEIVKGLRTMDDIFNHYKPNIKTEFEDPDGQTRKENLHFSNLRDFEKDGLMKNSAFLKELGLKRDSYTKIEKQLRTNKVLRDAISNPESKIALIKSLQALLKELKDAE